MERENLFIVLSVILMLIVAIYEALITDRGSLVFGSYLGSGDTKNNVEYTIDGYSLPPLIEYRKALNDTLYRALINVVNKVSHEAPMYSTNARTMISGYKKYYDKAFSRFMFTVNTHGNLTKNLIPKKNPVDFEDIAYYMNSHQLGKYSSYLEKVKYPVWPTFNEHGPKVSGQFTGNAMTNSVTGDTLPITNIQYERLREIYTGPPELFDSMAYSILYVYFNLGGLGNNGSVPIGLIDKDYIELFGSPLNTQQRFCSPFKFEVDQFSSLGSFFDYHLLRNQKYTCNPPYVDSLMTEAMKRVTKEMTALGPGANVSMLVVIPIWDRLGIEAIGSSKPNDNNKDERYQSLEIIEASGLVRAQKMLHKDDHKYYSWYGNKFVAYSHTYLFVLSTEEKPTIDLDDLVARWDSLTTAEPTSLRNVSPAVGAYDQDDIKNDIVNEGEMNLS